MCSEVGGCAARSEGVQRGRKVCSEVGGCAARLEGVQRGWRVCSEVGGCAARRRVCSEGKKVCSKIKAPCNPTIGTIPCYDWTISVTDARTCSVKNLSKLFLNRVKNIGFLIFTKQMKFDYEMS